LKKSCRTAFSFSRAFRKSDKDRRIHIVYNFIGAFDFVEAVTQSENKATKTEQLQQKTA